MINQLIPTVSFFRGEEEARNRAVSHFSARPAAIATKTVIWLTDV